MLAFRPAKFGPRFEALGAGRQVRADDAQLFEPNVAALAEHVVAVPEAAPIEIDICRQGVQRKVRRGEAEVMKQRPIGVVGGVILSDI